MTRPTSGPSSEVQKLQTEITDEVNGDAQHLATAVFGKQGAMPDMTRVSDEELTARYRTAYVNNDRQWLTQEAKRDPEQFVKVARNIGVMLPEEIPAPSPLPEPTPPPTALPAPVAPPPSPPGLVPVALPTPPLGVTLGAVGQPGQAVPYTVPPSV